MNCVFSSYIAKISDFDRIFQFIADHEFDRWKVTIASRDFTNEKAARAYAEECLALQFIPWAALFV